MKSLLLAISILLVFSGASAEARRRRAPKAKGRIVGQLDAPFLKAAAQQRASRAYWSFGPGDVQEKRPKPDYGEFIVFLDFWEDGRHSEFQVPILRIEGGAFSPRLMVIPRRAASETITVHNLDLQTHHLLSKDHRDLNGVTLNRNDKTSIKLDNILPLQPGRRATYRLSARSGGRMRGAIVFLKSSVFGRVDPLGRFNLTRIPSGEHTLRVYFRGKILLTKKVTVGRKTVTLKVLTLKP